MSIDLYSLHAVWTQGGDEEEPGIQTLDATVTGVPGGGCWVSIKTDRWSMDEPGELSALLGRLVTAAGELEMDLSKGETL
jgi:hypothetical protein